MDSISMMKVTVLALAICQLGFAYVADFKGGCELNLKTDLPKRNDPIYLIRDSDGNLNLAFPKNGSIDLNKSQAFVLACTGNKNSLIASGQALTETKCSSGSKLKLRGSDINSSELDCSSRSAASLLVTKDKCVDRNSVIIQSGFQVDKYWFPLVDTCHNVGEANSLWSRHTLYGSRLAGKVIQSYRPGFSRGNKQLFNPDQAYLQTNQEKVFASIYGKNSAAKYIIKDGHLYLARGHLSPDADFLFASWQMLTYFYVNVAPQWQSINAGNWRGVENNARKLAISLQEDLLDVTGTHGILTLPDDKGIMREAYLEGDRLPIPELYWKLLQNPSDNSCIVLISTNNPHLDSPPETICPDICSRFGWPVLQKDLIKGYVYCCDYRSFKAAAPQVPYVTCKSVLKFDLFSASANAASLF